MAFTSLNFIVFLLAVITVYYIIPKKAQWVFLLTASYAFYLFSGIKPIFYIIVTTLTTYFAALLMEKYRTNCTEELSALPETASLQQKKEIKQKVSKKIHTVQVITVCFNLGILAVLKYLNFIDGNINALFSLFGSTFKIPQIDLLVPLGLSFYTFQSIGYVIDIGRGKYKPQRNLGKYALFVSFFPQIVQGPISRYDQIGEQLVAEHKFNYENFKFGAQLILWGFFKKLVIADRFSAVVSNVFGNYKSYHGFEMIIGIFCYAIQIYADFSGGIDITRGAAQMMGIDLPINFERPYFSKNMTEYWRRWHITLGAWMREYVFYPVMLSKAFTNIGKKAKKTFGKETGRVIPSALTSFIVFFLIGIWHGATWQYIAFALYNATFITLGMLFKPLLKKTEKALHINTECFSWQLWQMVRTFVVLAVAKTLVKAPSLKAAFVILKKCVCDLNPAIFSGKLLTNLGITENSFAVGIVSLLVLLVVSILQENGMKIREKLSEQNFLFRWLIYIVAVAVVIIFGIYGPASNASDFIYQRY